MCAASLSGCYSLKPGGDVSDGGADSGAADLGGDSGMIVAIDAGDDGAVDGGGGIDLGVRACETGRPCDVRDGCAGALDCQQALEATSVPAFLPDGGVAMYEITFFNGGYCTNASLSSPASREGAAGACDPTPVDSDPGMDGCPPCSKCMAFGLDPMGINIVYCAERCTPSATGNPCRTGYTCDLAARACVSGCASDGECQVYRADTNGDGRLDTEGPDGGVSPDRLRLDVAGGATCNIATGRCTQPGTGGVEAGATCVLNSECEMDGRCISDLQFDGWADGYCSKNGCDVLGCAGRGKCLDVGGGENLCTAACKIADDPGDSATGVGAGDDDCRDGYACFWDGTSSPSMPINGGCLPGNYNSIALENIGAACIDPDGAGPRSSDEMCWSPYGFGECYFTEANSSCAVLGCANLPSGACGMGNTCVSLSLATSLCLRSCTLPGTCSAAMGRGTYGCVDLTGTGTGSKHCFPGCLADGDCNGAYRCDGAAPPGVLGQCVLR